MATALFGAGASVVSMRRLYGGLDGSTHAIQIARRGWVVLKRSFTTDPSWLAAEFIRLQVAEKAAVPTPDPLALDADGVWFGRPALVMSRLPGRARMHVEPGPWIDELASALAVIHEVALPEDLPSVLTQPHAGLVWRPPDAAVLPRSPRVDGLIAAAVGVPQTLARRSDQRVLLHHDFHHGNVLWRQAHLAGVLDWSEATTGPPVCDVAYSSVDVAMTYGIRAAERFVRSYQAAAGRRCPDLRQWQALWTVNAMRWLPDWMSSFRDSGADHITLPKLRRRLRDFGDFLNNVISYDRGAWEQ